MPKYFCYVCEAVSDQRKCPAHRIKKKDTRRKKSVSYAQRMYRKKAVDNHRAQYGNLCVGYRRQPHYATDLTADHIIATGIGGDEFGKLQIYCRSCNSSKQKSLEK